MNITIEQLQLSELEVFLREQADDAFPSLKDEQRRHALAEKWHTYADFCTCRDDGNRLVGMIAFYANQPNGCEAYVTHVYISSLQRGKGIFAQMLDHVKASVKHRKYSKMRLEVEKDNVRAQRAYMKAGFQFLPTKMGSGKSMFMELLL